MAKNSIRDYDATSANNTDVQSVDISEGCAASGINNAIREVMADLKDVSTGAVNLETPAADRLDVDNIRIDGNTISSTDTNGDITLDPDGTGDLIVASGNVGIGTTSPSANLEIASTAGALQLTDTDGTEQNTILKQSGGTFFLQARDGSSNAPIVFGGQGGGSFDEHMRINSSGNVGIGETSPLGTLHIRTSDAGITSVNGNADDLIVENNGNCGISIASSTSGEGNLNFIDSGDTNIGRIQYLHNNNIMIFRTNDAERMRLTGNALVIGADAITDNNNNKRGISFIDDNVGARTITRSATVNTGGVTLFDFINGNGYVGSIVVGGSSTSFNTSSDYRMKENVVDMAGAIDRVKQLSPRRFNFIADATTTLDGFLAHEAATVVPESVTGAKDAVEVWQDGEDLPDGVSVGDNKLDEDGNTIPLMQSIDQAKLVPLLTAALQEAIAKIETLETEMTALKARVTALEDA